MNKILAAFLLIILFSSTALAIIQIEDPYAENKQRQIFPRQKPLSLPAIGANDNALVTVAEVATRPADSEKQETRKNDTNTIILDVLAGVLIISAAGFIAYKAIKSKHAKKNNKK
jgi:hypothetical protein